MKSQRPRPWQAWRDENRQQHPVPFVITTCSPLNLQSLVNHCSHFVITSPRPSYLLGHCIADLQQYQPRHHIASSAHQPTSPKILRARAYGATVARLTPDQKVVRSNRAGLRSIFFYFRSIFGTPTISWFPCHSQLRRYLRLDSVARLTVVRISKIRLSFAPHGSRYA